MTKQTIIEMAREARLPEAWISETGVLKWSELEAFAALVRADEREALAQPVQEPSYAGVRMWVGNRHVMQGLTKLEFTRAVIEPKRLLELVAERCIKEVNNG